MPGLQQWKAAHRTVDYLGYAMITLQCTIGTKDNQYNRGFMYTIQLWSIPQETYIYVTCTNDDHAFQDTGNLSSGLE